MTFSLRDIYESTGTAGSMAGYPSTGRYLSAAHREEREDVVTTGGRETSGCCSLQNRYWFELVHNTLQV